MRAHLADVLAGHAELHREADRRPVLEPRHAAAQLREVGLEELEQPRAQPLALGVARRDEHELREVRLLQLLVERQVEARAAGADVGDVALDAASRASRIASSFFACASVAANELPSGRRRSTISSGRDDDGKNCCGTKRNSASDATNTATVAPITVLRCATHQSTSARKRR